MTKEQVTTLSSLQKAEKPLLASIQDKLHNNLQNDYCMLANFQPAKLLIPKKSAKCRTWRISWYNYHPYSQQLERITKTFDINRIKNKKERHRCAAEYIRMINTALRNGYNYFLDTEGVGAQSKAENEPDLTIHSLVTQLLPHRTQGMKDRTITTYRSYTNKFCEWLTITGYDTLPAKRFDYALWLQFVNYKLNLGHSGSNINHFSEFFYTNFKISVKMRWLNDNPLTGYKRLKTNDNSTFETFTDSELCAIRDQLQAFSMRFYIYTKFIALQFIRPYHLAFIKSGDIDYTNSLIKINALSSKNSKAKYKQLMPELKRLLIEYNFHEIPTNYYIFGKDFMPSENYYKSLSNRAAEVWRELVVIELGINKKMYALKHTASQYYLNNNSQVDTAWLQHQMEHSSLAETQTYIASRQVKKIDTGSINLIDY